MRKDDQKFQYWMKCNGSSMASCIAKRKLSLFIGHWIEFNKYQNSSVRLPIIQFLCDAMIAYEMNSKKSMNLLYTEPK